MDVLVLGGTSFVGRAIVDALLDAGHAPTLFTRGRTGPQLFPGVPRLVGDRDTGDYTQLAGVRWDAVVDVSAYVPRHIDQAATALAHAVDRYVLISTGSVYDHRQAGVEMTERSPRLPAHRSSEEVTGDTYGPLKVACEDDVQARYGSRATIVRPGIVAGPYDPTDRFTYWVRRAARGGRIAVPGRLDQPVQVVDSRDLARLVGLVVEGDVSGTFHAVGPEPAVTLHDLIATCATAAGSTVEPVEVTTRVGFPLVLPDPSWDPMFRRSTAAARAIGMPATPLVTTARDTLAWDRARGEPALQVGLSEQEEQLLLATATR